MKSKLLGACLAAAMVFGSLSSTGQAATLFQRLSGFFQQNLQVAQIVVQAAPEVQTASPAQQLQFASAILQLELLLIGNVLGGQNGSI